MPVLWLLLPLCGAPLHHFWTTDIAPLKVICKLEFTVSQFEFDLFDFPLQAKQSLNGQSIFSEPCLSSAHIPVVASLSSTPPGALSSTPAKSPVPELSGTHPSWALLCEVILWTMGNSRERGENLGLTASCTPGGKVMLPLIINMN